MFNAKRVEPLEVQCFADSDWAGSVYDRWSTSGYSVTLGGNVVIWKRKRQHVAARYSAEVE